MELFDIARRFAEGCAQILQQNLTGVYLHGSLAMGCWNAQKSDIDLLVVTEAPASAAQKRELMDLSVSLNSEASEKGLEMSMIQREFCAHFVHPTPFDLHFSPMHLAWYLRDPQDYIDRMNGTDPDLAAHFTVTRSRGFCLCGAPISQVFGEVPRSAYLDSILADSANASEDILTNPVYTALNLCRILAYACEGAILSKQEGGQWALPRVRAFSGLIHSALESYRLGTPWQPDAAEAQHFCAQMKSLIDAALQGGDVLPSAPAYKGADMLDSIKSRRSTRKFSARPLERQKLEQIIEAGRYAPSGGNNQQTHFLVITDPQTLRELSALVKLELSKMEYHEGMYKSLANSISAAKKEKYDFHYNPAALIVTANRRDYGNAMADCSCALENMMLMANALDLGSCWINHLRWLRDNPAVIAKMCQLGMTEDEFVCGAVSIGYADTPDSLPPRTALPRTGNPVTYID